MSRLSTRKVNIIGFDFSTEKEGIVNDILTVGQKRSVVGLGTDFGRKELYGKPGFRGEMIRRKTNVVTPARFRHRQCAVYRQL